MAAKAPPPPGGVPGCLLEGPSDHCEHSLGQNNGVQGGNTSVQWVEKAKGKAMVFKGNPGVKTTGTDVRAKSET